MNSQRKNKRSGKFTASTKVSIVSATLSFVALLFTFITINGANISYVEKKDNLIADCIRDDEGKCSSLWAGTKYLHFRISMDLKNLSFVSGYIDEVSLYPCIPKLYPLDYDVYRIDRVEFTPFSTKEFSFLLALAVPEYGSCFGVDLRDNRGMSVPAVKRVVVGEPTTRQ